MFGSIATWKPLVTGAMESACTTRKSTVQELGEAGPMMAFAKSGESGGGGGGAAAAAQAAGGVKMAAGGAVKLALLTSIRVRAAPPAGGVNCIFRIRPV